MAETTPNKYTEAFASFAPALSAEEIDQRIQDILSGSYERNNTREVKKFLHSTIDLTTLSGADTEEKVAKLVASVNDFEGTEDVPSSRPCVTSSPPKGCR